ncbi:MAG: ankyrin repeat domain-containing protein [Holosporaceae bacterium]|jgi:ankyrin repeat protein|nr:ankyrin repeat domain-containing protein [Holosporaceae bacterium]
MKLLAFLIGCIPLWSFSMPIPAGQWYANAYKIIKTFPQDPNATKNLKDFLLLHQEQNTKYANAGNPKSRQPLLSWVCKFKKYAPLAKVLISSIKGIDLDIEYRRYIPLAIAVKRRNLEMVDILLETQSNKANINLMNKFQQTPIFYACVGKYDGELLQKLINSGADVSVQDVKGNTPLHLIVKSHFPAEAVKILAKQNQSLINIQNKDGNTPLHLAIDIQMVSFLKLFFTKEIDYNIKNKYYVRAIENFLREEFELSHRRYFLSGH